MLILGLKGLIITRNDRFARVSFVKIKLEISGSEINFLIRAPTGDQV